MSDVDKFLEHLDTLDLAPSTRSNYKSTLNVFFTWFAKTTGQAKAAEVTLLDVKQYKEHLLDLRRKPGTINGQLDNLSVFFQWCIEKNLAAGNPVEHIKRVGRVKPSPRWLDKQEVFAVVRAASQAVQVAQVKKLGDSEVMAIRRLAILTLMLNTGIRVGELCNLRLEDLKLNGRTSEIVVYFGKGGKYRELPLNADARRAVETWLKIRLDNGSDYLFLTRNGGQMSRHLINWAFRRLSKESGVKITPHMLRHTFGKNLVNIGTPIDRVAMLMGHGSISTTMIYTVPDLDDLRGAVDKISWSD